MSNETLTIVERLRPVMLCGLTWKQALNGLKAVDCALRRPHWCSPVVVLVGDTLLIDDDGDMKPFSFTPRMGDRYAKDWMMVPRVNDDGDKVEPTYRAKVSA